MNSNAMLATYNLSYAVGKQILIDDINLHIDEVGLTVIMGPNGAGKSLLLRLLHGLVSPTAGHVTWDGQALNASVRSKQAMVFQRPVMLRRSVAANLNFVLRLRPSGDMQSTDQLLREIGLYEKRAQPARQLSGGEQQRLALARALAMQPDVLLMDEPTASLDPASTQFIEQMVSQARTDGTHVLFVTHDIGQARRLADRVIFMHRGKIAETGAAPQFFDNPTHLAAQAYLDGRLAL